MENKKVVGVFQSEEEEAISAINSLKDQGYHSDDISVIAKERNDRTLIENETGTKAGEGAATGIATGGIGGLLAGLGALAIPGIGPIVAAGPITAAVGGAALGAGAGGLVGVLIGMGIPEEHAKEYENYVHQGDILVLVDDDPERRTRIYDTFRSNNTKNSDLYDQDLGAYHHVNNQNERR